ncbi:MAG: hypothetical protein L0Y77_05775 [Chlorobi bacterium]|nr:hypothetical protein [Chlorobiota bacterium]
MDFSIFYKEELPFNEQWDIQWDLFIAAYNPSNRCKSLFDKVKADSIYSILLPEYEFEFSEVPNDYGNIKYFKTKRSSEKILVENFFGFINQNLAELKICLDMTGFMRPQYMYILKYLYDRNIKRFDVLYAEPLEYKNKENTMFSDEYLEEIRQVNGYEGNHLVGNTNELLIVGSGYDHKLIRGVCDNKKNAEVIQIYGFPSLKADMIQQNILRAYKAIYEISNVYNYDDEEIFWINPNIYYAPANDPFVTANLLDKIIEKNEKSSERLNIYLSPLSSKPQTLGFALYYLWNCINKPISIIFPIPERYERETTKGIARIWKYTIEFP